MGGFERKNRVRRLSLLPSCLGMNARLLLADGALDETGAIESWNDCL